MDISSHDKSDSSMDMGIFHWSSTGDGFWLKSWVPQSEAAYIGACFGLFFISILSRTLPAIEAYFTAWKRIRNHQLKLTHSNSSSKIKDIEDSPKSLENSSDPLQPIRYQHKYPIVPSFSLSDDTIRGLLTTLSSFLSYLLMMVVMTGNGGFLLVIVVGVFVGEMAFGRYKALNVYLEDYSN